MLKQPIGVVQMTNVSFIKYKVENKKFEIACYKNKAINFRNGVEKDLSEVLQTDEVYLNASHGEVASKEDLKKYFPKMSKQQIIKMILEKGELQIGDKERDAQITNIFNDIVNIITEKCVNPESKRQFNIESIRQAVRDIHFPIKQDQPPKRQALECIKLLQKKYYISRAEMKIGLITNQEKKDFVLQELQNIEVISTEVKQQKDKVVIECVIEPSKFRPINDFVKKSCSDVSVEVMINHMSNKEEAEIDQAGTVELRQREDWKEENDEQEEKKNEANKEEEKLQNQPKSDKKPKKQKKKPQDHKDLKDDYDDNNFEKQQAQLNKQKNEEEQQKQQQDKLSQSDSNKKEFKCLSCPGAVFDNNNEFRAHYKNEWHLFNVQRKAKNVQPLNIEEYKQFKLDEDFK